MARAPVTPRTETLTPAQIRQLEGTRRTFLANLVSNPNFYDTLPEIGIKAILPLSGNTFWEQLTCVGFNPEHSRLEAVVQVKRTTGYSGPICSAGSNEYVRFFVDWHDGAGFQDAGYTSFQAFDIPDGSTPHHPLHYLVTLELPDLRRRRCCRTPVLPRVRAILGWNHIPTGPNDIPPFGNRVEADVQVRPRRCTIFDLIGDTVINDADMILPSLDLDAPLPLKPSAPTPLSSLVKEYREAKVPEHRMLFETVQPLIEGGAQAATVAAQPDLAKFAELKIDIADVIKQLLEPKSDTSFEELVCVGLNPSTDTLGAVIHVKQRSGYSGNLCSRGSLEYVSFWADWDLNGTFDQYLGTASVNVHDIGRPLPAGGIFYGVYLTSPAFAERLRGCEDPNVVRIRAVLSWATPPSTTNPNALPHWGNREDVLVQVRPGARPGTIYDLLYDVGNVALPDISGSTFLAFPSSGVLNPLNCGQAIRDRPFAGNVRIGGRIYNSGAPGTVHYQMQFAPHGTSAWLPVSSGPIDLEMMHPVPTDPLYPSTTISVSPTGGYYPYSEDWSVSPPILERTALLAWWGTSGLANGPYDLRLEYTTDFVTFHHSTVVTVEVNNTAYTVSPTANAAVDTAFTVDLVIDGGDCHSYTKGNSFTGHLRAVHPYFGNWSLDLQPSTHTNGAQANPHCRSYGSLADTGDANLLWSLDTTPMDKCGYTLTLIAHDRRIVNSNLSVGGASKAVGFSVT